MCINLYNFSYIFITAVLYTFFNIFAIFFFALVATVFFKPLHFSPQILFEDLSSSICRLTKIIVMKKCFCYIYTYTAEQFNFLVSLSILQAVFLTKQQTMSGPAE